MLFQEYNCGNAYCEGCGEWEFLENYENAGMYCECCINEMENG